MERLLEIRTIGRAANCDLVLAEEGIEDEHARVALGSGGGLVLIQDAVKGTTALNRGYGWVDTRRIRLCQGDCIRVGSTEIPVDALTALFTGRIKAVETAPGQPRPLVLVTGAREHSKRNPGTGQIESLDEENN